MADELRIARDLSLPLDVLTEAVGIIATRGAGKTYGSVVLIEEAHSVGVPFVVIDPTGVYHGLRSSADGNRDGLPVYVIGGPHGDLPLEPASGAFLAGVAVDSGHSFVFDLSDLSKTKARAWVAAFLERLYERKARARTTLLLVVDEADEFAPQKATGASATVLGAMEQVVKRGRSRGIGCVLISQRTQAINKDVLDLIDTLIALRVIAPRGRKAIADWVIAKEAEDEKGVVASLNSLPTGRAWLWSPVRGVLEQFTFRRIRTFDSYATPRPGEARDEPSRRKELDLDALGEQMQATIERAKENDPAELRRRVRDLEQQLATADTPRARDEAFAQIQADLKRQIAELRDREPERVPVLTDKQIERLERLVQTLESQSVSLAETVRRALSSATPGHPQAAPIRKEDDALGRPSDRHPATPERLPASPRSPAPSRPAGTDVELGKGERKILEVLAEFPDGRTNNELAFLAGYSARASTISAILSSLRKAGLVEHGQPVRPTSAGLDAVGGPVDRPRGPALLEKWLRHPRMGEGERRILLSLVDAYPDSLSTVEIAERTGYSPTASTISALLSSLRKLGLVEKRGAKLTDEFAEAIR